MIDIKVRRGNPRILDRGCLFPPDDTDANEKIKLCRNLNVFQRFYHLSKGRIGYRLKGMVAVEGIVPRH